MPPDAILDIGCGEGALTARIAQHVDRIVGIDASPNTIDAFRRDFPGLDARVVDCRFLARESDLASGRFTKIFSNAALHWILRDPTTRTDFFAACFGALAPGGRMVSESGALGNVAEVHVAIISALMARGVGAEKAREAAPWWFPSLESMRALVEGAGFGWVRGEVDLRQTTLTTHDEGGICGWCVYRAIPTEDSRSFHSYRIKLFGAEFRKVVASDNEWESVVNDAAQALEAVGRRQHDGAFIINYIRLRFEAQKPK